jgi:hypothetical protein
MNHRTRSWPVPVALIALSAIPLVAGSLRLVQLAGGTAVIPADDRFSGLPVPLMAHIGGATTYVLPGVLQFLPGLGLAAGTQPFTEDIGGAIFGTSEPAADRTKGAGWVVNLSIAEWAIRRPAPRRSAVHARPVEALP